MKRLAAVVLAIIVSAGASHALLISYQNSYVRTRAADGTAVIEQFGLDALGLSTVSSSVIGGAEATAEYAFAADSSSMSLDVATTQARSGSRGSYSIVSGDIFFTTDAYDAEYDISGLLTLDGVGQVSQGLYLGVDLGGTFYPVAAYYQRSDNTVDESFVSGEQGGDFSNNGVGSLTGTLLAGQRYEYTYSYMTFNLRGDGADPATATGNVSLSLNEIIPPPPQEVPEPATSGMLAAGVLLGWVVLRRRKTN